jgi:protoheme IX farnesyltransferase
VKNPTVSLPAVFFAASRLKDYWALSKPRVTLLVWSTTLAGMVLATRIASFPVSAGLFAATLAGSWLVIASANLLNQLLEVGPDSKMARTRNRPLPTGRVGFTEGLALAVLWGVSGLAILSVWVNLLTALFGAVSIVLYAFAYTPLKPKTHLATAIGAIPGAIPPLAGWTAVTGSIEMTGVILFSVQFLWQFPHFWAIAWLVREDYKLAGFKMLPFPDADAAATATACLHYSLAVVPFALALALHTQYWIIFLAASTILSVWFVRASLFFRANPNEIGARKVLKATILYLPVLQLIAILCTI